MLRTLRALVDANGTVRLLEPLRLSGTRRALLTILEERTPASGALLSESALAVDWVSAKEDAAWEFLQQGQ